MESTADLGYFDWICWHADLKRWPASSCDLLSALLATAAQTAKAASKHQPSSELLVNMALSFFPYSSLLLLRPFLHLLLTPFSITSFAPFSFLSLTSRNKSSFLGRSQQSGIRLSHGWLLRENADLLSSLLLFPSFFSLSLLAVFSPQRSFYSHSPESPPAFQIVIIVITIITAMGLVTVM